MTNTDKEKLFTLCFGDTAETAREFFSIKEVVTLTELENGRLCAMASLLPLETDRGACGFYVYGVCVHPDCRGKGYFNRVMKKCEDFANKNKGDFLSLIPANQPLADTYRRMGYTEKLALYHSANKDHEKIFVVSNGFIEFARPEENAKGVIDFGLMKPLTFDSKRKMAFFSPMGDC